MARTLRELVRERLDTYERALTLTEAEIRRGVASVDRMTAAFIVTDDLLRAAERHRFLLALVCELRDLAGACAGDPTNPPAPGGDRPA